jgi:hypothetical protein
MILPDGPDSRGGEVLRSEYSEADPISGVFLIPLGLPWNRMSDVFPDLKSMTGIAAAFLIADLLGRTTIALWFDRWRFRQVQPALRR